MKVDGTVSFDGQILDGWAPLGSPEGRGLQSD
jgi:hypothetical protein